GEQRVPMFKRHEQGFFVAALEGAPARYSIHARRYDAQEIDIEDPYHFGQQISDGDLHLHTEGTLYEAYRTFGAHPSCVAGVPGVRFAVWAPNAVNVTVAGDFNDWDIRRHPMRWRNGGVWEIFLPHVSSGATYKYHIRSRHAGYQQLKADPYAFFCETPPKSA